MAGLSRHLGIAGATAAVLIAGLGTGLGGVAAAQTVKAGPPRYYLEQGGRQNPVVRATATGRVTGGRLACPGGAAAHDYVPADHQTFFIACPTPSGGTQIYRFRLTASGRVGALAAVRGGNLSTATGGLAASADGSTLAVSVGRGADDEAIVINTRTGAHATWTDGAVGPGMIRLRVEQLALSGNGRKLIDTTIPRCVKGSAGNKCRAPGKESRVVSPASAGGSLSSSRLIMRQSVVCGLRNGFINDVAVTSDGRSLIVAVVGGDGINDGFVAVDQVSAATGHVTKVLDKMKTGNGFSYQFVSTDPSGRFVLFDAGTTKTDVNGWIDHGRLVRLRPAGNNVVYEAWSGQ
ncbi:MAG TPA: hypothetical protein VHU92_24810 [Streptosporangiaceae bacterium]|nr:hypothetical protein [Streptosporangiaceae bacterium]